MSAEALSWEGIVREMFGALDLPLSEAKLEALRKGCAGISAMELARCRDLLLADLRDGEPRRRFGVPELWALKRRLRAPAPPRAPGPVQPDPFDAWAIRANELLLAHIRRRLAVDPRAYGPVRRCLPGEQCHSAEQAHATHILVAHKNAWARDMRESENPTAQYQRECWADVMQRAESEIAALLRAAA